MKFRFKLLTAALLSAAMFLGACVPAFAVEETLSCETVWSVPVKMMHASKANTESMGNPALDGPATVTVKDNEVSYELNFKGIVFSGLYGHLLNLWHYPDYEANNDSITGVVPAVGSNEYRDTSLSGEPKYYFRTFTLTRNNGKENEFFIRISVDAMAGFDQDAKFAFDWSNSIEVSGKGKCGANLNWKLENGLLDITGSGAMEGAPWNKAMVKEVKLDKGITSICDNAFTGVKGIPSTLFMSENITGIGANAFTGCGITDVYFDGNAPAIEENAFDSGVKFHYIEGTTGWDKVSGHTKETWTGNVIASGKVSNGKVEVLAKAKPENAKVMCAFYSGDKFVGMDIKDASSENLSFDVMNSTKAKVFLIDSDKNTYLPLTANQELNIQ